MEVERRTYDDLCDVMACGNVRATYVDQGKDNESSLSLINMNIGYKSEKITDQRIPEPPGSIGESCDLPGSTRRSSNDWKNDERRVGPGPPLEGKIRPGTN
jgi:hypothetical protein